MKQPKKTFREKAMMFVTIAVFSVAIIQAIDHLLHGSDISVGDH